MRQLILVRIDTFAVMVSSRLVKIVTTEIKRIETDAPLFVKLSQDTIASRSLEGAFVARQGFITPYKANCVKLPILY